MHGLGLGGVAIWLTVMAGLMGCGRVSIDEQNAIDSVAFGDSGTTSTVGLDSAALDTSPSIGALQPCDSWTPVDQDGWTRRYQVILFGEKAFENQTGWGRDLTPQSEVAYQVLSEYNGEINDAVGSLLYRCDDGLQWVGWESTLLKATVIGRSNPSPRIFPPAIQVGSALPWSFEYDLHLEIPGLVNEEDVETSGTCTDFEFTSIEVPAGVFDPAYRIQCEWSQDWSSAGGQLVMGLIGLSVSEVDVVDQQYYVDGLGLVYQIIENRLTGETVFERRLEEFTGLEAR